MDRRIKSNSFINHLSIIDGFIKESDSAQRSLLKVLKYLKNKNLVDCVVLYPYAPAKGIYYNSNRLVSVGLEAPQKNLSDKPRSKGLSSEVRRRKEVIVNSIDMERNDLKTHDFIKREGIQSFFGTVICKEHVDLGLFFADFRKAHRFSEDEIFFFRMVVTLFGELLLRDYESDVIKSSENIYHKIRNTLNINETLREILIETGRILNVLDGVVFLYESKEDKLVAIEGIGYYEKCDKHNLSNHGRRRYKLLPGEGVSGYSFVARQPIIFDSYHTYPENVKPVATNKESKSHLCIPLLLGEDECFGVITFESDTDGFFQEELQKYLNSVAKSMAMAIDRVNFISKSEKRFRLLYDLGQKLLQHRYKKAIIQSAIDCIYETTKAHSGSVRLYNMDNDSLEVEVRAGRINDKRAKQPIRASNGDGTHSYVFKHKEPLYISDITQPTEDIVDRGYSKLYFYEGTKSSYTVPILFKKVFYKDAESGELLYLGNMNFESPYLDGFTYQDQEFIQHVASQAALALKITEELQQSNIDMNEAIIQLSSFIGHRTGWQLWFN